MALSRRMAAPFFVVLLVIIVAAETATARDVVEEHACQSQSHDFKGLCLSDTNCESVCLMEMFVGGKCKFDDGTRKCFCNKFC